MMRKYSIIAYMFGVLALLHSTFSVAAEIGVSPIHFYLSAKQTRDVLKLTNKGNEPVLLEIKPYLWLVKNKKDVYLPTRDIYVGPPMAQIQPQKFQLVRLALLRQPPYGPSLKYRIYIEEIPTSDTKTQGVRVRLKIGVPIYVEPSQ